MDRRYQVFISSTYTDLAEERREVIQALLEMDCLPAGMEMFPATSDEQWTLIQQVIDESDYYVVIVGGRYGSTTPEGISYTEKEYDYAVETGKPVLGFVHAKPEEIALGKSQPEMQAKMDAFRAKVMSRLVKPYTSAAELGSVVSRSMIRAIKQYPVEGWVRGQHAMTPETQAELAELRAKVKELELDVQASTIEIARIPEDLASGEDTYDMEVIADYIALADMDDPFGVYDKTKRHNALVTVTWNQMIGELGIRLIDEASEEELAKALNNFARRLLTGSHADLLPSDFGEAKLVGLPQPVFDRIMLQLFALNLTEHGKKPRGVTEKNKYWALTELGKDTLMKLRAIKKQPAEVTG